MIINGNWQHKHLSRFASLKMRLMEDKKEIKKYLFVVYLSQNDKIDGGTNGIFSIT